MYYTIEIRDENGNASSFVVDAWKHIELLTDLVRAAASTDPYRPFNADGAIVVSDYEGDEIVRTDARSGWKLDKPAYEDCLQDLDRAGLRIFTAGSLSALRRRLNGAGDWRGALADAALNGRKDDIEFFHDDPNSEGMRSVLAHHRFSEQQATVFLRNVLPTD